MVFRYKIDRLVNRKRLPSTRGLVETGHDVRIGGLIVGGGPAAIRPGCCYALLDHRFPWHRPGRSGLEVRNARGMLVASNDNWKTRPDGSSQQAEIEATTIPPSNDLESALLLTLPAGNYTAIMRGKDNTTGVGLIEAYNLP
jgi:hypothetical protein